MTNKFSCFLTQKGRWLTATLFLLFSLGIGNAWGTDQTFTVTNPETDVNVSGPIIIQGEYNSSKKVDNTNQKTYVNNNAPLYIQSKAANIKKVTLVLAYTSNGSGSYKAATVKTMVGTDFDVPESGVSAKLDDNALTSLSDILINNNNSSHQTLEITCSTKQSAVSISKGSAGSIVIKSVSVVYDDAITAPGLFSEGHFTSATEGTASNGCSWSDFSLNGATKEVNSKVYYKRGSAALTYNLASNEKIAAGDVILVDFAPGTGASKTTAITLTNGPAWSQKTATQTEHSFVYVVPTGSALINTSSFSFTIQNNDTYVYGVQVYHTSSGSTPDPGTSCTTPTIAWATGSTANISVLNELEATNLGINVTEYTGNITWALSGDDIVTLSNQSKTGCTVTGKADAYGTATLTASFTLSGDATLCDGTYSVTKTITIKECVAEPAALTNEIARFQVPCDVDNTQALTSPINRTECTCTFAGVGGSGNWYQNPTSKLWYGKMNGDGTSKYITITLTSGSFQAGDVVTIAINRDNTTKSGFKIKSTSGNTVEPESTASGVEAIGTYTLTAGDIDDGGSLTFFRSNSSTYVNRIIVTREPSCDKPVISAQPEDASLAVGDANPTLSFTATGATSYAWKESSDGTSYNGSSVLATTADYTPSVNGAVQTKYYYCELTNACGTVKTDIVTVTVAASITYYTVTLVPAGGTIVDATGWTLNAGNYEKTVAEGTELALPTFTKANRTFKQWVNATPEAVASPVTVNADMTLTAVWNATIESVLYSWESPSGTPIETGGTAKFYTGDTDNSSATENNRVNAPNKPINGDTETQYYTLRLDKAVDYTAEHVRIALSSALKEGDKIKITAYYTKNQDKTVAPKIANGSDEVVCSTDNLVNLYNGGTPTTQTKTLNANAEGATTLKLTRSATSTTAWITKLQIIRETLVEEANLRTVTFDSNGGSSVATVEVASGSKVAAPADPTWAHHRFNGWKLNSDDYDFSTAVTSNITLVADWTLLYTISFAAGDGSGDAPAAIADKAEGETFSVPANTFTAPEDKEFNKWNDGSADYAPGATYTVGTANVVLTALWKAPAAHYAITYTKGANGTGTIEAGDKTEDVAFTLSAERFTRDGYVQTGWATEDGGAKAYDLGGSYTANAAIELFPVWTALDTYTAAFGCSASAPAGWTFSNNGWGAENATAAYVCTFVDNSITTPKQAGKTTDDMVAFAKNTAAVATFDLGITTIVAGLDATLIGGSGDSFNEKIEFVGEDGTTVKKSYTNSLSAGNWLANNISETDIVENVRYIKVYGASKWVVMSAFSIKYVETRTKYDVEFAANGGTGDPMPTLKYVAGAEVALPACTFTAPEGKEFDAWTSSDVTISDGKFTMPASDVTVTATWKTQIIRYDVTFETNGGSTIDAQEVEANGNPTAVANPTKTNYVFMGWFNNSDLAPEHAVADITALTITEDITLYAKWQLDVKLRQVVFSNGFDAFIKNNTVEAYYMEGTSAPTMVSYQGANLKAENAVAIVGNKVQVTGSDESVVEYDLTLEAVAPMTSYDLQTFDGTETYVKTGNAFSTASDKYGWKFSKNDNDWTRETPGQNRIYFFVGGSADKVTFTSGAPNRAIKVYVNNELVSSVTATAASGSTFDIPLPAANANNMIAIVSDQTSGDGSVKDLKLNEHVISTDVSLASLTVNGNAIALEDGVYTYSYELPYGTVDAPTVVAVANAAPYATVSDITVDGTTKATFIVTAENSDVQPYIVNFSIARFPSIVIWDGSTMSAVATSPDATTGFSWTITGFSSVSNYNATCGAKAYTKCLPSGGSASNTRYIELNVPEGKMAKFYIVFGSHSDSEESRGMFIGTSKTKDLDESSILTLYSNIRTDLKAGTSELVLGEGTWYINPMKSVDFYEISATLMPVGYQRNVTEGRMGTVCLPKNVEAGYIVGAEVYTLLYWKYGTSYADCQMVDFEQVDEMQAGYPYLIIPTSDKFAVVYGNETYDGDGVHMANGFTGTINPIAQADDNVLVDKYGVVNNMIQKLGPGCYSPANRAYIDLSETPSKEEYEASQTPNPAPKKRVSLGHQGTQVATGLDAINVDTEKTEKIMIDGQMFIIRGGHIFDATGRLVK